MNMVIKPIDDHHARTKLLCLENTIKGKVLSMFYLQEVANFYKTTRLSLPLKVE
jgi:threonine aldolase